MIFILIAIVFIVVVISLFAIKRSSQWLQTEGKILESRIREISISPGTMQSEGRHALEYEVVIEYQYSVNGTQYTANKIMPMLPNVFTRHRDAQKMVEQFPESKTTTIYYNPNHPDKACLISASSLPVATYIIIGIVLLLVLGMFYVGFLVANGTINIEQIFERLNNN